MLMLTVFELDNVRSSSCRSASSSANSPQARKSSELLTEVGEFAGETPGGLVTSTSGAGDRFTPFRVSDAGLGRMNAARR